MSFPLQTNPMMDISSSLELHRQKAQAAAASAEANAVDPRMRQAAEGFEALFLQQMLKAGRAASLGDDLLGGSGVERMQSMLDQTLTENAANQAGLGLADAIVRQFAPLTKKAD
ncbi:rod-binding protein [Phaeobacter sp. CNT1-3]|jgi:flagellar protein FlgJ|nr:rod-binding protein [Phaeobacter sp. CNT1-3]